MNTNDIKRVIDAGLSGVEMTEQHADAILRRIREDSSAPRSIRRRLPIAAAAALILLLIGSAAVAAMSIMGVFEAGFRIEKEEQTDIINYWSLESQMELVNLLVNAGANLNNEKLTLVYGDGLTDEEKSALILEILVERFPPTDDYWAVTTAGLLLSEKGDINNWTHEERVWINEVLDTPFEEWGDNRYLIPSEEDMSEEEAYEIAFQYYLDNYGLTRDCFDASQQFATFSELIEEDLVARRHWTVNLYLLGDEYNGQPLRQNHMSISIRNDGSILAVTGPDVRTWEDDWNDVYLTDDFFTIEKLYAFEQGWKQRAIQLQREGEHLDKALRYLITKTFGLPGEGDISIEEARRIAEETVLSLGTWDEELLSLYNKHEAYMVAEPNQYYIIYTLAWIPSSEEYDRLYDRYLNGEIMFSVRIRIDAQTGEVLEIFENPKRGDAAEVTGL